jgi:hypothetical protein
MQLLNILLFRYMRGWTSRIYRAPSTQFYGDHPKKQLELPIIFQTCFMCRRVFELVQAL